MNDGVAKTEKHGVRVRLPVFLLFAGLLAGVFAVLWFVRPYGDDFFYGRIGRLPLSVFWDRQVEHYQLANGRALVHLMLMPMLRSDVTMLLWRVINALFLTGIAYFIYKTAITAKAGQHSLPHALLSICAVALPGISMTRQSVYWLTGSFNYVYPMFCFMLFWRLTGLAADKPRLAYVLPPLALVTGASTEQAGMMCFGLCVMSILQDRVSGTKLTRVARYKWVSAVCALTGQLTIYLAPAFTRRVEVEDSPVEGGMLALLKHNLVGQSHSFLFSDYMSPFICISLAASAYYLLKKLSAGLHVKVASTLSGLTFAAWFGLVLTNTSKTVWSAAVLVAYVYVVLTAAVLKFRHDSGAVPLTALILCFGSQAMMLVSPVFGSRTQLCAVFMLVLYSASLTQPEDICVVPALCGLAVPVLLGRPELMVFSLAALAVAIAAPGRFRTVRIVSCLSLALCAVFMLYRTGRGYMTNAEVYNRNLAALSEAAQTGAETVIQEKYPLEAYAWAMPYHNPYYDPYYNEFYGLPTRTKIEWTEPNSK